MDRLLSLKNDVNTSLSSEGGYETANDDSVSSLYYSINNDTLTDDIISSPVLTEYDAESTIIVSDQLLSYATNVNDEEDSNATGFATESAMQTSPEQTAEQLIFVEPEVSLMHRDPLLSCVTDVNGEGGLAIESATQTSVVQANNFEAISYASNVSAEQPEMSSIRQESLSYGPDATASDAIATAQTVISRSPIVPPLSTNLAGNSQIVTVSQQQNQASNAVHPPNPSQGNHVMFSC